MNGARQVLGTPAGGICRTTVMCVRLRPMRHATVVALFALSPLEPGLGPLAAPSEQRVIADGLKIVVIDGEDAVNIIQQKTAVAPIVEVRDRNDQPVSGAVVTFAIRSGRATFSGARTLTLTTNAAGRATAAGLTPTGTGAVQIGASAAFQGQTAVIAIAQTNVLAAAEAAAAGGAGASGGGSAATGAGAAGGSAGGLSATTIGIIGAAAGAGAIATAVAANGSDPGPKATTYTGPYAGQILITFSSLQSGRIASCVTTRGLAGTLSVTLNERPDGTVTGSATTTSTSTILAKTCPEPGQLIGTAAPQTWGVPVTGTAANLAFTGQQRTTGPNDVGGTETKTDTLTFTGALVGGVLSGTMTFIIVGSAINSNGLHDFSGSATVAVTLR